MTEEYYKCLCLCAVVFVFALAIVFWVMGCNPNVPGGCLTSSVQLGVLIDISYTTNQCCEKYTGSTGAGTHTSCKNNDYSCCTAERTWNLTDINRQCSDKSNVHHNCTMDLGTSRYFTYNPRSGECIDALMAWRVWVAGVCILSGFAFLFCVCVKVLAFFCVHQSVSRNEWTGGNEDVEALLLAANTGERPDYNSVQS